MRLSIRLAVVQVVVKDIGGVAERSFVRHLSTTR